MKAICAAVVLVLAVLLPTGTRADEDAAREAAVPHSLLHGFEDVTFRVTESDGSTNAAFGLGQFDLFFVSNLAPDISFLAEVIVELEHAGETDVERMQIKYSRWDQANITIGRVHTAIGYWNTFYHHGKLLQPTVERPAALAFEDHGGILPVHSVGAELSGRVEAGSWQLGYVTTVANGRAASQHEVQAATDANTDKAVGVRFSMVHGTDREFEVGVSGYRDRLPPNALAFGRQGSIDQLIGAVHARFESWHWTLLGEAYVVRDRDRSSHEVATHRAGYALAVLNLGAWKPYAGVDILDVDARDAYFSHTPKVRTGLAGVRYDLNAFNALKLELRREKSAGVETNALALQTAFMF